MAYRHDDLPFVLLWSEKSGCTSLFQWMLLQTGEFDEADSFSDWIHDWEHAIMKARTGYAESLVTQLNDGAPASKLVRSPFERAVSSFLMLVTLGDDSGHFTVELRRKVREFVYGAPDAPWSFGFIDFLRWMATQDITTIDGHLGLQFDIIEDRIPQLELIRLEQFDAEMGSLEQRFGLPAVDLRRATTSRHHTQRVAPAGYDPQGVVRIQPPIPLFESGFPLPHSADFMTPEAVDLISTIYRTDVEAYGYEPPEFSTGLVEAAEIAAGPAVEQAVDVLKIPRNRTHTAAVRERSKRSDGFVARSNGRP